MGWFSWGKPAHPANIEAPEDLIWLNDRARINAIRRAIADYAATANSELPLILVGHFPAMLAALRQLGDERAWGVRILICQANEFFHVLRNEASSNGAVVEVIVAERHLSPVHDDRLLEDAGRLPMRLRVTHHLSFDDPVIRLFSKRWTPSILAALGLNETEPITSKSASKARRRAQQKLAKAIAGDLPAESAEEWGRLNAPLAWKERL